MMLLSKTMNYQVFFQFSLVQFLLLYQRSSRLSVVFGNSSTASSTGSLNEQDVIGDIVDEVKKVLPQAISSVQQNAGNTKRDTTTELIQAIIQEGVKLTPEIISFKGY